MNKRKNLYSLGIIEDFFRCVEEFNAVRGTSFSPFDLPTLNDLVEVCEKSYLNKAGYPQSKDGEEVTPNNAEYIRFQLPIVSERGDIIFGWYHRHRETRAFTGPQWGSLLEFKKQVWIDRHYKLGSMIFAHPMDGYRFLRNMAESTIQEKWESCTNYAPDYLALRFHLISTMNKAIEAYKKKKSGNLVFSSDGRKVWFDTNLLTRDHHQALVAGEVEAFSSGRIAIIDPYLTKREGSEQYN